MNIIRKLEPFKLMDEFTDLCLVECGKTITSNTNISAIFGASVTESSFKSILGLGLLLLSKEKGLLRDGQPIIESTSGSLGVGISLAGKILGHPVHLISDKNIPKITRKKIELLGAKLYIVNDPAPTGGFQQSRDDKLQELLKINPDFYYTNQNNNLLNPEVYRKWLIPKIENKLDLSSFSAGVFCVGSGGHFVALAELLNRYSIKTFAADRIGSITFGGEPSASILRGTGNQNIIPEVIRQKMGLAHDIIYVSDQEAINGVKLLASNGIYVGGSSGLCFSAACKLADQYHGGRILTFFPDRGELYSDSLFNTIE